MEVSKLEISKEISKKELSRNDIRKLRLKKVEEKYGDTFITSVEFCSAAGFDMTNPVSASYKKGMNFIQRLKKSGIVSSIPSGELDGHGKPVTLYRIKFIPEGVVTREAKSTIKKFTKNDMKALSLEAKQQNKAEEIVEQPSKEIVITAKIITEKFTVELTSNNSQISDTIKQIIETIK